MRNQARVAIAFLHSISDKNDDVAAIIAGRKIVCRLLKGKRDRSGSLRNARCGVGGAHQHVVACGGLLEVMKLDHGLADPFWAAMDARFPGRRRGRASRTATSTSTPSCGTSRPSSSSTRITTAGRGRRTPSIARIGRACGLAGRGRATSTGSCPIGSIPPSTVSGTSSRGIDASRGTR